jgi:hypothetical protein
MCVPFDLLRSGTPLVAEFIYARVREAINVREALVKEVDSVNRWIHETTSVYYRAVSITYCGLGSGKVDHQHPPFMLRRRSVHPRIDHPARALPLKSGAAMM